MDGAVAPEDEPVVDETRQITRNRKVLGISLLGLVVLLWTSSNFITQDLFEGGYEKPFLVTYLNTSAFAFYLLPWAIRRLMLRKAGQSNNHPHRGYEAIAVTDTLAPTSTIITSFRAPSILSEELRRPEDLDPLTIRQTAQLASVFCIFWFIANWAVNASLSLTSVASATILSSTSGFFTLLIGRIFKVESLTLAKICAVVTSFFGVVLVSVSDSVTSSTDNPTNSPSEGLSQNDPAALGDGLALISAIFYALYVILLKVKIKEENRIDMQLFFGFVGLFNVVLLWPIGILLHVTGAEPFQLPPDRRAWIAVVINMLITWSSDYLYVLAMLKTTPLIVTIGLSLTIPLAIIGDFFLKIPTTPQAVLGAILVLGAFIVVGVENSETMPHRPKNPAVDSDTFEVEDVEAEAESNPGS